MSKETELMMVYLESIKCNPDYINIIKKDLNRLEKQDKAITIIKKNSVDVGALLYLISYNKARGIATALAEYNLTCVPENKLTQEEFDLIRKVFK